MLNILETLILEIFRQLSPFQWLCEIVLAYSSNYSLSSRFKLPKQWCFFDQNVVMNTTGTFQHYMNIRVMNTEQRKMHQRPLMSGRSETLKGQS